MSTPSRRLELLQRQKELEESMKRPGGARIIDERELKALKETLERARTEGKASEELRAARCSLADFAPRPAK